MSITIQEISDAVNAAWRMAMRDPDALAGFDLSERGFWKSFWVIALAAPFWLWLVLSQPAYLRELAALSGQTLETPSEASYLLAQAVEYLLGWIVFPLVMVPVVRLLEVRTRYVPYIIAHNWAMFLVYFVFAMPPIALYNLGLISVSVKSTLDFLVLLLQLAYLWQVARSALAVAPFQAVVVVLVDIFVSAFIAISVDGLYAL